MSREIQDRLRAAFESKTAQVTASSLRPAEPPQRDDRPSDGVVTPIGGRRHHWAAPLLAAAAVVAIAAGTTAAVTISADGHHHRPANTVTPTPTPTPTSPSTTASSTPSAQPTRHVVPPGTGRSSTSPANGSSGGPPEPTHAVTVQGVTLQVPVSWRVGPANGSEPSCITVGGVPERAIGATAADNCQLKVQVISVKQVAVIGGFFPDHLVIIAQDALCGSGEGAGRVQTVDATNATVGGQPAEYRAYTGDCFKGTWEHWVVPTAPGVVITRSQADPATEAAARYAVANAVVHGPRSPLRLRDTGLIRSVDSRPDGVHISLDRVTMLEQGGITNTNSATYSYVLPSNLQIRTTMSVDDQPLTVQDLVLLANGKTVRGVAPPLSSLVAWLTTDGNKVTGLSLSRQ